MVVFIDYHFKMAHQQVSGIFQILVCKWTLFIFLPHNKTLAERHAAEMDAFSLMFSVNKRPALIQVNRGGGGLPLPLPSLCGRRRVSA